MIFYVQEFLWVACVMYFNTLEVLHDIREEEFGGLY